MVSLAAAVAADGQGEAKYLALKNIKVSSPAGVNPCLQTAEPFLCSSKCLIVY